AGLLCHVGAAVAVLERNRHEPGRRREPAQAPERGRTSRRPSVPHDPAAADTLVRLRERVRAAAPRAARADGLAQDSGMMLALPVGLFPVVLFLIGLVFMDSYKLVTARAVVLAIGAGVLAAGICYGLNRVFLEALGAPVTAVTLYVAP